MLATALALDLLCFEFELFDTHVERRDETHLRFLSVCKSKVLTAPIHVQGIRMDVLQENGLSQRGFANGEQQASDGRLVRIYPEFELP